MIYMDLYEAPWKTVNYVVAASLSAIVIKFRCASKVYQEFFQTSKTGLTVLCSSFDPPIDAIAVWAVRPP